MGLAGIDVSKPVVKIDVLAGAREAAVALEDSLIKFQYLSKQGKGQVPKIMLEFDNSDGMAFNPLVLAVGLKLGVRFGYAGLMSKSFIAPVKSVRAYCLPDGGRSPKSARPDAYGTVLMEMHLHKAITHLKPSDDKFTAAGPMRISEVMRRLAKNSGYRDDQIHIQRGLGMGSSGNNDEPKVSLAQVPEGASLLQYMRKIAIERGFYLSVTDDEFRFHRPDWKVKPKDVFTYFMGPDILSFSVDGDYSMNTGSVQGKAYDPFHGVVTKFVLNIIDFPTAALAITDLAIKGGGYRQGATRKIPDVVNPKDFVTTASKKLLEAAAKRLTTAALNKWSIKLSVVGNPVIFENDGILLDNFGPVVDGMWIVREVEHRVDDDGYSTHMTLKGKTSNGTGGGKINWPVYITKGSVPWGALNMSPSRLKKSGKYLVEDKGKRKNKGATGRGIGQVGATIGRDVGQTISRGTNGPRGKK